jgi:5-oxopent-3-ene-1,2,5-tricarboxylate decarboxylase / 2-hydroxyhepta-2,4-diene-1,7-dioate isomerase
MVQAFVRRSNAWDLERIELAQRELHEPSRNWQVPVRGTIVGTLLNHPSTLVALGAAMHQKPYGRPPVAPVLYIKSANTVIGYGAAVRLPQSIPAVEIGATIGIVMGQTTSRVRPEEVDQYVKGYVLVNDLHEPHTSVYRPAIRQRCRDTFCAIAPCIVASEQGLGEWVVTIAVDGVTHAQVSFGDLVRPVNSLVADVSEFMTLHEGDVLLVGHAATGVVARVGQTVRIACEALGTLENPVVADMEGETP